MASICRYKGDGGPCSRCNAPKDQHLALPVVHLNGTSRESLMDGQREVATALREALEKMTQNAPHPRDYLGAPMPVEKGEALWKRAQAEHQDRVRRTQALLDEVTSIYQQLAVNRGN
jgi:hypothetical protein